MMVQLLIEWLAGNAVGGRMLVDRDFVAIVGSIVGDIEGAAVGSLLVYEWVLLFKF